MKISLNNRSFPVIHKIFSFKTLKTLTNAYSSSYLKEVMGFWPKKQFKMSNLQVVKWLFPLKRFILFAIFRCFNRPLCLVSNLL